MLLFGFILLLAFQSSFCLFDSESSEEYRQKRNFVLGSRKDYSSLYYRQNSFKTEGEGEERFYTYKSACYLDDRVQLIEGFDCRNQIAVGRFRNSINSTGWSYLEIETKSGFDTDLQAYAAGILEGVLSQKVIDYALQNTFNDYCKGYQKYCARLNRYLNQNLLYIKKKIENAPKDDPYWQSVRRSFFQLTGVWDGFNNNTSFEKVEINYNIHPIMMININGELYDLDKKFNKTKDPVNSEEGSKCSGLVKVTPNNADLLISQVTMSGFQNLLRVLKLYKFGYDERMFPGHTTTFASYPGMLYSSDDFALLSSGLASIETTIAVWNQSLYDYTKAENQLHTWVRAIAANQLARTGREWCQIFRWGTIATTKWLMCIVIVSHEGFFRRHNSGTYNNQWIVLDYKKFQPYRPLPDHGLLYVLEQMPGLIVYKDITGYLEENKYYASYNIPFFRKISEVSGFAKKEKELYWFSWSDCPRAKIFKRDHSKVVDLETLKTLMRYNDYTHEPFSRCNCTPPFTAEAAVSARGDLNPANGTYPLVGMGHVNHGALDYKGTNYQLFKQLRFRALSSPAYDNVPPFQWSKCDLAATVKHVGHPDLWNFESIQTSWETPNTKADL